MDIQSLSVVVPGGCPNACAFCVSRMHDSPYPNRMEEPGGDRALYEREFQARMAFARDNGCNNLLLTGQGEPVVNRVFLERLALWNTGLAKPFRWLELQTSGVTLDPDGLRWLRTTVGISTLSLSLSDQFDSAANAYINGTPPGMEVDIDALCLAVKKQDLTLRLSLNMTDRYNERPVAELFRRARELGADQVTFRKLYGSGTGCAEDRWVAEHSVRPGFWDDAGDYVRSRGRALETLPFGATRWSVDGLSTVLDDDCMSTVGDKAAIRYLILRPDARLYTKWDDPASRLF